jgi:hypothetical protein
VKRFYTRTALVKRAAGSGCARVTVGLIGLHIAQKTAKPPAVDLVVVRAGRRGAAEVG